MARKEEIENVICIEEADSKLTKCAQLLANNDKNEMKEDNKSALNFGGHSLYSAQLLELADAVKYGTRMCQILHILLLEIILREGG